MQFSLWNPYEPSSSGSYISKWCVFQVLDTLHSTATGLDHVPKHETLQRVFSAVVISETCQVSSAMVGFTSARDRQHLKAFLPP